jgi:hypothetical protein
MHRLRDRLRPSYVDYSDVPEGPVSPYRARLTTASLDDDLQSEDFDSREVVRGEMRVVYEIRCGCGRRWFNPSRERVQICPRCGRAVLLEVPN